MKIKLTKHQKIILIIGIILAVNLAVLGFLLFQKFSGAQSGRLEVIFFDVGQGDSIFIRTPASKKILIDGGPDNAVVHKLGKFLPYFDREIDLLILTHSDPDHITGLIEVLKRYPVRQVLYNGISCHTSLCVEFFDVIAEKNIPLEKVAAGRTVYLDDDLRMDILHPEDGSEYGKDDLNNSSVTAKLIYQDTSFLLTGDIEEKAEKKLLNSGVDFRADVLKAAHHGSDTSTTEEFLNKIRTKFAVISVGADNKFGHPSRRVLNRLERSGAEVFRTDEKGDVIFISDGKDLSVRTEK